MKSSFVYTIVFMLIISAAFALLLAGANAFYLPKIEENELLDDRKAVLYIFDIDQGGTAAEVLERFDENVEETELSGVNLYAYVSQEGEIIAYALPFQGAALWGAMYGYLGLSPDLTEITGLVFTEHSETPGLGGRIDELQYKEQFRGISIDPGARLAYGEDGGNQIDAITGATSTSNAVLNILNDLLDNTVSKMEVANNG